MTIQLPSLPRSFAWGVATASCQIEGAADRFGKGPSVWDVFASKPGAIYQGHDPSHACEHLEHLEEDLDWLGRLGVNAYRFSVSWPRVLPHGRGRANEEGLAFYDRLVDGLLARDITPYLTVFHWDFPQALEDEGGFRNPESPRWFAEYTELLARRYGDRVKHWFTVNEPHAFIEGGLRHGRHAPGHTLPLSVVLQSAHHVLLCHGRAAQVIRANVSGSFVTSAPVLIHAVPATSSDADREAARRFTFELRGAELRVSSFWMDPMYLGHYPEEAHRVFGADFPKFPASDLELIRQPLDAFGANLYDAVFVRAGADGEPEVVAPPPGFPRTAFGWPVTPSGHFFGPLFAYERYGLPVLVTESGLSTRDWVALDGEVHDPERVDYIERHLLELDRAAAQGVPIAGYFHWSLLDNFEWNHGYRERFGLVHVDFSTFRRTPKDSFFAYRDLIEAQRRGAL